MPPKNAPIDQNTRQAGIGLVQGSTDTYPFSINTSNELLIEVIPVDDIGTLNVTRQNIPIDENARQGAAGVTDDFVIIPLTTDEIVGLPVVRVEIS
jgi:hypothetical protein